MSDPAECAIGVPVEQIRLLVGSQPNPGERVAHMPRLIGATEVTRRLSVCRDTVYAMARDGQLKPVRLHPGANYFSTRPWLKR